MACTVHTGETLFCSTCGKLREPGSLRRVRLQGFTGAASLNPNVEQFWESGDPSVFDRKPVG